LVLSLTEISLPTAQAFSLFRFTSHTFTGCGTYGSQGPSQTSCRSTYSTTWDESDENFRVVGGIQYWTVPFTGRYYIDAYGAGGGGNFAGGGARIADTFDLTQGEVIRILVGQAPLPWFLYIANGGGGGTFVTRAPYNTDGSILVIAGGGGGVESATAVQSLAHASITTSGNAGYGTVSDTGAGAGGTSGGGGGSPAAGNGGGGGGGFSSAGADNSTWNNVGGASYINGGAATIFGTGANAIAGGFGGGGGANGKGNGGGSGGGGGYSGGGGSDNVYGYPGGGGGSYVSGLNINRVTTVNARPNNNNGYVTITALTQPTVSLSIAGNANAVTKGQSVDLVATVNQQAQVVFYADGKKISNCINRPTASGAITCSWKPSVQKSVTLTAAIVVGATTYVTSPAINVAVVRRTGIRS
jgi:hypothetical protein